MIHSHQIETFKIHVESMQQLIESYTLYVCMCAMVNIGYASYSLSFFSK